MDSFITLIIFFLLIGLLERVLKAASKKQQRAAPPPEVEGPEEARRAPSSLQELIAEQLGISLERRPRVRELPEAKAEPADRTRVATRPPERRPATEARPAPPTRREVAYPRPSPKGERRTTAAERGLAAARERRAALAKSKDEPVGVISLEEPAALRRDEAVSLEVPRRPEDHRRFHERYAIPESPRGRGKLGAPGVSEPMRVTGERRRGRLPERAHWSAAARAIVWSEILGPPKGLTD